MLAWHKAVPRTCQDDAGARLADRGHEIDCMVEGVLLGRLRRLGFMEQLGEARPHLAELEHHAAAFVAGPGELQELLDARDQVARGRGRFGRRETYDLSGGAVRSEGNLASFTNERPTQDRSRSLSKPEVASSEVLWSAWKCQTPHVALQD